MHSQLQLQLYAFKYNFIHCSRVEHQSDVQAILLEADGLSTGAGVINGLYSQLSGG